jgi:hypothetical protein
MESLAREVTRNGWLERLARFGYVTRGVVHALVGALALQAALGLGGETTDAEGALWEVAERSTLLLWAIAVGLAGYAVWRLLEALADPEGTGTGPRALGKRVARFGSGLAYAALAFAAFRMAAGGPPGPSDDQEARSWSAELLAQPFGRWLLAAIGLGLVIGGCVQLYRAFRASFRKHLRLGEMSPAEERWAVRAGRFGLLARGVVFALAGGFLVQAALRYEPSRARGVGGVLATLARQPYGPGLLAAVALGLIAYGVLSLVEARYRRLS